MLFRSADAKRQRLDVETMDGEELQQIVAALYEASPEVKAEVKQALEPAPVDLVKSANAVEGKDD